MLFREKCHFIGFPFKVNFSELEVRISTVLSKNKIQGKGKSSPQNFLEIHYIPQLHSMETQFFLLIVSSHAEN